MLTTDKCKLLHRDNEYHTFYVKCVTHMLQCTFIFSETNLTKLFYSLLHIFSIFHHKACQLRSRYNLFNYLQNAIA